jgi:hypothetical protein
MLRATPQLRATPPVFWECQFEVASQASLGIPPNAQLRMYLDTYMRAAPTRVWFDAASLDAARAALRLRDALLARQLCCAVATVYLALHPCQKAAHFLMHTRPPDHGGHISGRPRRSSGGALRQSHRPDQCQRVFVTTRSGTDTMARRRQDTDDELTEANDTAGATTFGGASIRGPRQVTRPSMSADLRAALAMPTTFGTKLYEITTLLAIVASCKHVKDAGDLLLLRETLIEELGPAYMWLIILFVVEWATLHEDKKVQHTDMRLAWLSSYSKASEAVLQHWIWKLLKKKTEVFAPLHRV